MRHRPALSPREAGCLLWIVSCGVEVLPLFRCALLAHPARRRADLGIGAFGFEWLVTDNADFICNGIICNVRPRCAPGRLQLRLLGDRLADDLPFSVIALA